MKCMVPVQCYLAILTFFASTFPRIWSRSLLNITLFFCFHHSKSTFELRFELNLVSRKVLPTKDCTNYFLLYQCQLCQLHQVQLQLQLVSSDGYVIWASFDCGYSTRCSIPKYCHCGVLFIWWFRQALFQTWFGVYLALNLNISSRICAGTHFIAFSRYSECT